MLKNDNNKSLKELFDSTDVIIKDFYNVIDNIVKKESPPDTKKRAVQ